VPFYISATRYRKTSLEGRPHSYQPFRPGAGQRSAPVWRVVNAKRFYLLRNLFFLRPAILLFWGSPQKPSRATWVSACPISHNEFVHELWRQNYVFRLESAHLPAVSPAWNRPWFFFPFPAIFRFLSVGEFWGPPGRRESPAGHNKNPNRLIRFRPIVDFPRIN